MIIGLDARYLSHGLIGGVRTYVYQLARHLPRLAPDARFVYYIDTKAPFEIPLGDLPANVSVRTLPWSSPLSSVWNDRRIARWMERDGVDIAHFPANAGPAGKYRLVVTLHDALNLFPMWQHLRGFGRTPRKIAMMLYLGMQARAVLRDATRIVTVSEHARADIAARGGISAERITAIHSACHDSFRPVADLSALASVRQRLGLPRQFLLADGIKNPGALLAAYDRLPEATRAAFGLVFFTREAAPRPELAPRVEGQVICVVVRPAEQDLIALMSMAYAFVFPSWYEGFGLPLVEAMSCGAPVVASTRGSIPEVVGGAGLLFDVESVAELQAQLMRVTGDPALREQLHQQSLRRSRDFSWEATARQVLAVYQAAVAARTAAR